MNTMRIEITDHLATMKKEVQRWCRVVHPFTNGDGRGHVTLLLCLVFLAILLRTAWLSDDALITLRTVLNFTHGYGLTFNVAERVQTYTHPLWMLMLTGTYLVAGNVYYAAIGLSVGISLVVFWSTLRLAATSAQVWIVARGAPPQDPQHFPARLWIIRRRVSRTRCRICCLSPSSRSCSVRVRHARSHPLPA